MLQIINVTDARKNFAKLIESVKSSKKPVIVIQDSSPSVVIYPYEEIVKKEAEQDQLFQMQFERLFAQGRKSFANYLKENKIKKPQTEEEAYTIIKNA